MRYVYLGCDASGCSLSAVHSPSVHYSYCFISKWVYASALKVYSCTQLRETAPSNLGA